MEEEPGTRTRRTAAMDRVSLNNAVPTLHEQLLYPHHLQWAQGPAAHHETAALSRWLLQICANNPHGQTFSQMKHELYNNSIINFHNTHGVGR
jgi:hypothetical protein